jgi:hypothetical protein
MRTELSESCRDRSAISSEKARFGRDIRVGAAFVVTSVLFYWKVIFTSQFSFLTGYEGVNQAYS